MKNIPSDPGVSVLALMIGYDLGEEGRFTEDERGVIGLSERGVTEFAALRQEFPDIYADLVSRDELHEPVLRGDPAEAFPSAF